jgi:phosphatidylglycerophosphatase A
VVFFWHYLGNRLLTTLSNMLTDMNLTDMEVCYKMFRREVLKDIRIEEDRFGFEVEITAKVARGKKWRIYEVPVSYYGRSYAEGKKITWRDGFWALWCILKYGLTDRGVTPGSESEPLSVTDRAMVLVANGFGLGNAPVASGTVGALLGLLVAFVVTWFPMMWEPLVAAVLCLVAVPICDVAERHYKSKDDGRIVADEFLTFPICLLGLPWLDHPWLLVVAFGVSRACDVIKPAPARQAQDIKGGWGIVLDDAVANVYALVINHFVWILFG